MKYIQIRKDELWTDSQTTRLNSKTMQWEPARPELYWPNFKERFIHWLGYHFTFGQPYCVVCGYAELLTQPKSQ